MMTTTKYTKHTKEKHVQPLGFKEIKTALRTLDTNSAFGMSMTSSYVFVYLVYFVVEN